MCPGYRAEIAFYRELAPTLDVDVPHCHLAVANGDATSFTLVLEDMAPAVQGDQIAGAPVDAVAAAARNLSGLHAPRWCDPSWLGASWLQPSGPAAHLYVADLVSGALPQLAARLGPALADEDRRTLSRCSSRDGGLSRCPARSVRADPR